MNAEADAALGPFVEAAQRVFGEGLRSVVLFGSGAEDRLRPVSDLNVVVVLRAFDPEQAAGLREDLRLARAGGGLRAMFLVESELSAAAEAFAFKFADIVRRRRVLYGTDPFSGVAPSRAARIAALRQTLLNAEVRLRERWIAAGSGGATRILADAAGTWRAAAAELLDLGGEAAPSPREALSTLARRLAGDDALSAVEVMSAARQGATIEDARGTSALRALLSLGHAMTQAAERLVP